jgi:hypothetical protein
MERLLHNQQTASPGDAQNRALRQIFLKAFSDVPGRPQCLPTRDPDSHVKKIINSTGSDVFKFITY